MVAIIEIFTIALGFVVIARLIDMINDCKEKKKRKSFLKELGFTDKEIEELLK